jgi:osmoprotectant transport system ATP-binding protein
MVNRLIEPSKGVVEVGGRDVMAQDPVSLRLSMGYVFQGIGLFPHMTIGENVGLTLRLLKWPKARRLDRISKLLQLVGLSPEDYTERFPDELSGGQQQRVGVARALAADPGYLLMDEPFGALDSLTRRALQRELLEIKSRLKKTIIFVTHDVAEALLLADRIGIIHEGRLEQLGTGHEVLDRPETPFVRELLSEARGSV